MAGYIVRRLLQAIPVLLGTTFLIYFMVFAMPGDPIIALFGEKTPPPAVLEAVRERYNLDEPFIVQYLLFLGGIFRGDFGVTFTGQPVSEILAQTFPVTLRLALLSTIFLMVGGILVGLISGLRK
jgi:oligopeptide transport system permease protein